MWVFIDSLNAATYQTSFSFWQMTGAVCLSAPSEGWGIEPRILWGKVPHFLEGIPEIELLKYWEENEAEKHNTGT